MTEKVWVNQKKKSKLIGKEDGMIRLWKEKKHKKLQKKKRKKMSAN